MDVLTNVTQKMVSFTKTIKFNYVTALTYIIQKMLFFLPKTIKFKRGSFIKEI